MLNENPRPIPQFHDVEQGHLLRARGSLEKSEHPDARGALLRAAVDEEIPAGEL